MYAMARSPLPSEAMASDYLELLKPRVISLVVFTGWVGLMIAPGALPPFIAAVAVLCIAVGAGAAGALNMWYDRDIDAIMSRTKHRPLPSGRVAPESALAFGVILATGSILTMGLVVNWVAAGILAFSIFFYVAIYTLWLKRRTAQNIVIGGAAGAFPPMIGYAAVTGDISWLSFLLFAIIFMWTPPHFWALALYRSGDYASAHIPMLPVVSGVRVTQWHIVFYSVILVLLSCLPWVWGEMGPLYGVSALGLGAGFLVLSFCVLRKNWEKPARRLFAYSIFYLFFLFLMMVVDKYL